MSRRFRSRFVLISVLAAAVQVIAPLGVNPALVQQDELERLLGEGAVKLA